MKRLKLLLGMAALAACIALTVLLASPYAPAALPCPENIEEIWAIEDAREESERPLATRLENGGVPLAYDAASNTFYCTLGMNQGDGWPQLHITAPGAKGVQLVFADDYTYDFCRDAIAEGYSYGLLTYDRDEFNYAQIVFTGLPLVSVFCEEEIGDMDVPAQVRFSGYDGGSATSAANIHLRGNGTKAHEKKNLKVEFTRGEGGKRNTVDLLGFGRMEEILLNPMAQDVLLVRDRLSWDVYAGMLGEGYAGGFGALDMQYAEVFLNDEYYGVYLLMEPLDAAKELRAEGDSHLLTDSVYKTVLRGFMDETRPALPKPVEGSSAMYELRHAPAGAAPFAAMQGYCELLQETDDEAFSEKAEKLVDIESAVRYALLTQATGLTDNGNNNTWIWAKKTQDGMRYVYVPWDMDMSWGECWDDITRKLGAEYDYWRAFDMTDRIIALNVGGAADRMVQRWRAWRGTFLSGEAINERLTQYLTELSESGALVRNADRWGNGADMDAYVIREFIDMRYAALDKAMERVENREGIVPFLADHKTGLPGYPMLTPPLETSEGDI